MKTLPDYLKKGLDIIFVGVNPGITSAKVGHYYYDEKRNPFWKILFDSGLADSKIQPENDSSILEYGYGLTDLVKRPTKSFKEIKSQEYEEGRKSLEKKIRRFKPKIICFNGKTAFRKFISIKFGFQEYQIDDSIIFVAPSTSKAYAKMSYEEKVRWYAKLKEKI